MCLRGRIREDIWSPEEAFHGCHALLPLEPLLDVRIRRYAWNTERMPGILNAVGARCITATILVAAIGESPDQHDRAA